MDIEALTATSMVSQRRAASDLHRRFMRFLTVAITMAASTLVAVLAPTATVASVPRFTHDVLGSVSCPSSTMCMALGSEQHKSGQSKALAEQWNGSQWSVVEPSHSGGVVSCPTSTDACVAVGGRISDWNGATWTTVPKSVQLHASLDAVSCVASGQCVAVGEILERPPTSDSPQYYADASSGLLSGATRWQPVALEQPVDLTGVSCTSSSFCMAVGSVPFPSLPATLAEEWNGGSWSVVPSPSTGTNSGLTGVSCTGPSQCTAVGESGGQPLVETWDGTTWTVATTPSASGAALLTVSCPASNACMAVGTVTVGPQLENVAFAEQWNGVAWTIVPTGSLPGSTENVLDSVSCPSAVDCMAVGVDYLAMTKAQTLAEQWNGTSWSQVTSPSP